MNKFDLFESRAIRIIGMMFGLALIWLSLFPPVSEPDVERTITVRSVTGQIFMIMMGVLLIIPWRVIQRKMLKRVLLSLYVLGSSLLIIGFLLPGVMGLIGGDKMIFSQTIIPALIFGFVLLIQIPEMIKTENSNQNMDPIVTTPVDKVEAQSTQGHV